MQGPPRARAGKNQDDREYGCQCCTVTELNRLGAANGQFTRLGDLLRRKAEYTNRPGDVLDLLLAEVRESQWKLVANLIARDLRDAQATRFTDRLKPRRDVHAVAENILTVDNDVANIDADAADEVRGQNRGKFALDVLVLLQGKVFLDRF